MQISVASSSLIAQPLIEAIIGSTHTLASVITTPDQKAGRGQTSKQTELADWADEQGVPVAKPGDTPSLNQHLLSAQPQMIITASYGRMIPVELLHGPRFGWLNVHFSMLPKWRGAAPVQWSLLEGESSTGISIFKLDKGIDTGPVYFQEEVQISPTDTTESLLATMSDLAGKRILDVVAEIMKGVKPKAQPLTGVTLAPKITKEMAQIHWNQGADQILRLSRALSVRPGTWCSFKGERIAIHQLTENLSPNDLKQAGSIGLFDGALLVRCGDSTLSIDSITPAGKKRMTGADFARGARITAEDRFE